MRIRTGLPALAIALVLCADVVLLTQQDQSTAVTLADAVEGFRSSVPEAGDAPAGGATAGESGTTTTVAGATPAAAAATTAASTAPGPGSAGPTAAAAFSAPAEGVYSYRTSGHEEVSLGGGRHDYPERSYAAVRRRAGCDWEIEHRVLEEHVERAVYCSQPGRLTHSEERSEITFFGQANGSTYRCDPPMVVAAVTDLPGTKRTVTCRAEDGQAVITTTFVGRERLTVGGVAVEALRVLSEGVVSGRAEGTSRSETWLHPDTGLMLKHTRKVQTRADAFGTTVDYREDAAYELERLEPTR